MCSAMQLKIFLCSRKENYRKEKEKHLQVADRGRSGEIEVAEYRHCKVPGSSRTSQTYEAPSEFLIPRQPSNDSCHPSKKAACREDLR